MRIFIRFLLPIMIFVSILLNACGAAPQAAPMPATPRLAITQASPTVMVANMAAGGSNSALESPAALPSMTSLPSQTPLATQTVMVGANSFINATPLSTLPSVTPGMPTPFGTATLFGNCDFDGYSDVDVNKDGVGDESRQNALKNRTDTGNYIPVEFDTILKLRPNKNQDVYPTPTPVGTATLALSTARLNWTEPQIAMVAAYEGLPITVEGYIWGIEKSGTESTNCKAFGEENNDWHLWLTPPDAPDAKDRVNAIVVETTPRVRKNHKWDRLIIDNEIKKKIKVRISGWLFFDPEHPGEMKKADGKSTRGTLWEIHPVMEIELLINGNWKTLDDCISPSKKWLCG